MYKTVTQITQAVLNKIGLVSGTGVQSYTEPQIETAVQDAFLMLFRKRFWEHLSDWYTYSLDGVNGVVTTDLTTILKSHEDVKEIYDAESDRRIVKGFDRDFARVNGSNALYYSALKYGTPNFTTRVLQFWPKTSLGSVSMYIRTCPDPFIATSIVPFPADIIEWATTWLMLETDGMNPGNAAKAQGMFQMTYSDYVSSISDGVVGHGANRNAYTVWKS